MSTTQFWYQNLIKPTWAPPSWLFGPVWTALYCVIAVSFGTVFFRAVRGTIPFIVALPFILNMVFNLTFSPIQFGLQNNLLAMIDIFLVLGTLIWALAAIYKYVPWVVYVNIPYLTWACFATVLQVTITVMNW